MGGLFKVGIRQLECYSCKLFNIIPLVSQIASVTYQR